MGVVCMRACELKPNRLKPGGGTYELLPAGVTM